MKHHDIKLYNHFVNTMNVSPGLLGWKLMSSLFTELLSREDWLRLMDFLFLYFHHIEYVILVR